MTKIYIDSSEIEKNIINKFKEYISDEIHERFADYIFSEMSDKNYSLLQKKIRASILEASKHHVFDDLHNYFNDMLRAMQNAQNGIRTSSVDNQLMQIEKNMDALAYEIKILKSKNMEK